MQDIKTLICALTCVRAFAFHLMNWSQIKAQYTPRTPLFEFWLNKLGSGKKLLKLQNKCYKVSWGGKMTATQSSMLRLSIKRLKECSFTPFHHVFWKRTIFERVPVVDFLDFLVPKVHWGLKNMWKKFRKMFKKFDNCLRNFVRLLFQICFIRSKRFQILPLDGDPQHLIHVKLC